MNKEVIDKMVKVQYNLTTVGNIGNSFMDLRTLLDSTQNHLDFWEQLENNGGKLLFEEYVALYLKATLPGDTYWLGEDVVPAHIAQKYGFANLLKGKRSEGTDIINVYQNRAVAYESKWLEEKETINLKLVANKQQVINKTGIDQLIFATNARQQSAAVTEWVDEAGFMFQEEWITKEVFDTVKAYINSQVKKIYKPMTPRPECLPGEIVSFFQQALDELKESILNHPKIKKKKIAEMVLRIFQHWPAASGKGSFPRLAYDYIIESLWDYRNGFPINTVINPTLTVLKGNLVKQIHHDLGLGNHNNVIHAIYAGDVTKAAKDTEELQTIRSLARVFTNKIDFVKFLRETQNQTVWVHTTVHSYDRLAKVMKGQEKSFFFAHIDEVHHMIQPDYSSWTASLDDNACPIQFRFMSSANRRKARGKGASYSMDDPSFCDIEVKDLDEKTAVLLGFKRKTVLLNYVYNDYNFPVDWIEKLEEGSQPLIKLKDTDIVVPMSWFMAADSLLRFRIEYSERNHTKLTLNSINECQQFAKFFTAFIPKFVNEFIPADNEIYDRLTTAKIIVADTQNNSTVKLLKEVSAIPDTFKDSFIIHCRLLGEGWDPENGWIDSNMFVSPTHSEIRIYQDVNRGSRIGDGSKSINYVVQFFLKDEENHFNDMFARINEVGEALEIGIDEITEQVVFKEIRNIPKGKKLSRQAGTDVLSYYDEVGADFFANSFNTYIKEGRYHRFGGIINDIIVSWIKMDQERRGYLPTWKIINQMKKDIKKQYKDFFSNYKSDIALNQIVKGEHFLLSDENSTKAIDWQIEREELAEKVRQDIRKIVDTCMSRQPNWNHVEFVKIIEEKYGTDVATIRRISKDIYKKYPKTYYNRTYKIVAELMIKNCNSVSSIKELADKVYSQLDNAGVSTKFLNPSEFGSIQRIYFKGHSSLDKTTLEKMKKIREELTKKACVKGREKRPKTMSIESRKKISASGKGRKQTPEQIAKRTESRKNNIIKKYGSMEAFYELIHLK